MCNFGPIIGPIEYYTLDIIALLYDMCPIIFQLWSYVLLFYYYPITILLLSYYYHIIILLLSYYYPIILLLSYYYHLVTY